jgi:hypothetical protein
MYGENVIGNHAEKWFYRVETGDYVFVSLEDYKPGRTIEPKDYKIVIPEAIIGGLIELFGNTGRIRDKDRNGDLQLLNRLIDTVQMQIKPKG